MTGPTRAVLRALLERGDLPVSALGRGNLAALRSLFESGALARERVGTGVVIRVRQRAAVEALARYLYPLGLAPVTPEDATVPRAHAIACVRNAKRSRRAAAEPVLLRAFRPVALSGPDGKRLDVFALTTLAGVAALTLSDAPPWGVAGTLAVVENLELFYSVERVVPDADLALYAGGRLSGRVLAWLGGDAMRAARMLHVGDYDPVGLSEYLRLKAACGPRAALHVPANLATLMRRYGKPALLGGRNGALLRTLRATDDAAVAAVVALMDETGCGLEQEALLIP